MNPESREIPFWAVEKMGEGFRCSRLISTPIRKSPKSKDRMGSTVTEYGGSTLHCSSREELEEARETFMGWGLACYPRSRTDPPGILETWI